jgi:hypothetical protein
MTTIAIPLELPSQQYQQLTAVAQTRQRPVAEIARLAVVEWLENQARLEEARALMRELGRGLGDGRHVLHDVARSHDNYLYTYTRVTR